jgi:hypothetical protein
MKRSIRAWGRAGRVATVAALAGLALGAAALVVGEGDANACGGCFVPPGPSTQVSAHRMAFAISTKRTILWDQIQYVGDPTDFGWVLPIHGLVDVGVSSDELFNRLEGATQPRVQAPPPPVCPKPTTQCLTDCFDNAAGGASDGGFASAADASSSVDVWRQEVVGPYEATQLSSTDATALTKWLGDHGYAIPPSIGPVIDQYVKEGFGFLALKLVPSAGVRSMVPIRIAFDGASPTLPLRMVAAGTGAQVGIKLWVLGDGRWEARNFANAEIATKDLVWDWAAMGSNLGTLEQAAIDAKAGKVWITESSDAYDRAGFFSGLVAGVPASDAATVFGPASDEAEIEKAFPAKPTLTVSRLFAQLPQSALAADLEIQASVGGKIPVERVAASGINYNCPTVEYVYCPGVSSASCGPSNPAGNAGNAGSSSSSGPGYGCSVSSEAPARTTWFGAGLLALVAAGAATKLARRSRRS